MDFQLRDKLALITGCTAGIGYAIARTLAREGVRVIVSGRTEAAVNTATGKLNGDVFGFAGDLATAEAADEIARRHREVEILVNNLLTRTDPAASRCHGHPNLTEATIDIAT
jgi:NAD(P)-dependent dehydrogenase (short-subunit alcohol dehydrogenase family)